MSKLKLLRPNLQTAARRIAYLDAGTEKDRTLRNGWRAWYKTARWQKLRWQVLVRDLFTCQCGCGRVEPDTSLLVADHREPHRGDERMFWDIDNLQCLSKACHDSAKQRQENAARRS